MSDLFETRQKVEEGANWRGDITVNIDGEPMELTVRQMYDNEFWEVMSLVDMDELEALQDRLPEEEMEEFKELSEKDSLDENEEERLGELQAELELGADMFTILSKDTFNGIQQAAKYGWVPDEEDKRQALIEHADDVEAEFGSTDSESAADWLQRHFIEPTIEESTGFTSFAIGIKVLTETVGDEGN